MYYAHLVPTIVFGGWGFSEDTGRVTIVFSSGGVASLNSLLISWLIKINLTNTSPLQLFRTEIAVWQMSSSAFLGVTGQLSCSSYFFPQIFYTLMWLFY